MDKGNGCGCGCGKDLIGKGDGAAQCGCMRTRQVVSVSVRMHPNIGKTMVHGCRWMDGDMAKGQGS